MQGLQKYYQVLQNGLLFLDEDELQALDVAVYACLANYTYLAHSAMTSGLVRYNVVHKHHMFAHIPAVARATGINPRAVDTYTEESFISQGISCATNCLIGPGPASFGPLFWGGFCLRPQTRCDCTQQGLEFGITTHFSKPHSEQY